MQGSPSTLLARSTLRLQGLERQPRRPAGWSSLNSDTLPATTGPQLGAPAAQWMWKFFWTPRIKSSFAVVSNVAISTSWRVPCPSPRSTNRLMRALQVYMMIYSMHVPPLRSGLARTNAGRRHTICLFGKLPPRSIVQPHVCIGMSNHGEQAMQRTCSVDRCGDRFYVSKGLAVPSFSTSTSTSTSTACWENRGLIHHDSARRSRRGLQALRSQAPSYMYRALATCQHPCPRSVQSATKPWLWQVSQAMSFIARDDQTMPMFAVAISGRLAE